MRFLKEYATTESSEARDPAPGHLPGRADAQRGWRREDQRRNARNVDLNRDWLSQSPAGTRAIVQAVRKWQPDLIMDLHELHPGPDAELRR